MLVTICHYKFGFAKVKLVLIKVQQTSKRNKKGSILWRFLCHAYALYVLPFYLVCVLIILFTTHNSVFFFFVLTLTISILVISTFLGGLGKVCLFIKIICGVNQ